MKQRILTQNWDWVFGRGASDYCDRSLAIAYDLKQKILCWVNDCFFDMSAGIDWANYLSMKNVKEDIDYSIRKIIATEEGVTNIVSFSSNVTDRKYSFTANIKTLYGTIEVSI